MKLFIDFDNKKIKLQEDVQLGKLIEKLKALFPENKWKEFTLETNTTIEWVNPITIPYVPYTPPVAPYQPYTPWWTQPTITCKGDVNTFDSIKGSYCLSIN